MIKYVVVLLYCSCSTELRFLLSIVWCIAGAVTDIGQTAHTITHCVLLREFVFIQWSFDEVVVIVAVVVCGGLSCCSCLPCELFRRWTAFIIHMDATTHNISFLATFRRFGIRADKIPAIFIYFETNEINYHLLAEHTHTIWMSISCCKKTFPLLNINAYWFTNAHTSSIHT